MKAVILAGGYGTRLSEETSIKPKPMVEIGGKPMLWHIMKTYSKYGINEFIICCGYKAEAIKEYFANYTLRTSDVTFDLGKNQMTILKNGTENWKVTLVDTGDKTMTGGRLKRVQKYIGKETFCLTYGDGLTDANIKDLINFHKKQKVSATLLAVQPPGRFGAFVMHEDQVRVKNFHEKPKGDGAWINGGYFVLEPDVFGYIKDDSIVWEQEPMKQLARKGRLAAFKHSGFWQPMDTLRDKMELEKIWESGKAPWKVWK